MFSSTKFIYVFSRLSARQQISFEGICEVQFPSQLLDDPLGTLCQVDEERPLILFYMPKVCSHAQKLQICPRIGCVCFNYYYFVGNKLTKYEHSSVGADCIDLKLSIRITRETPREFANAFI